MNKFDERYEIRLAKRSDIEDIIKFIDMYWKKGHIVVADRNFFEYEYTYQEDVNFVIAIDRDTCLIEGIQGFIRCSSSEDPKSKDIWGSIWKVNDLNNNLAFLGLELDKRLLELTKCRTSMGIGLNPKTNVPLTKFFTENNCVKMKHHYLLNPFIDDYKIAVVKNKEKKQLDNHVTVLDTSIKELKSIEELRECFNVEDLEAIPYKDNWYINKRYFNHPYYEYKVYGLNDKFGRTKALLIAREVEWKAAKILRLVDYIGEQKLFGGLYKQFETMFKSEKYEYIDFYNHGFDETYILQAHFKLRTEEDRNIIPNYFEPFAHENIDIWVSYYLEETMFFKADSDQDRPNQAR